MVTKNSRNVRKFSFKEIEEATKNFETCIGTGGYGRVYKGEVSMYGKPTPVDVKRLRGNSGKGLKEFLTEIDALGDLNPGNLIYLLGYCDEGKEKIIVYEYAAPGSLDVHVANPRLSWRDRVIVAVAVAEGLDFLHNGKHQGIIIHRDIKTANILVDEFWVAKISDLGLSDQ